MTAAVSTTATAASQPSAVSAAQSREEQQLALSRMLVTFTRDQAHGADPATLSSLSKQITAAAKALGQHVTLPKAPVVSAQAVPSPATENSKVSVTA